MSTITTTPATTSAPAATTTTAAIGAPLPDELVGTWTSKISADDAIVISQLQPGFDRVGTWTMKLSATTFQFLNPQNDSPGPYPAGVSPTKELMVARELDCPGQSTQDGGLYTFTTDGTSLTLTAVRDDSCPFRQGLLVAHAWQKTA